MTETPEYGNSILIPATLTLLFYLLFVTCLGYGWHIAREKKRYFSCVLNVFCCETHSCAFCKRRQASFLISVRHKPFRSKKNNITNSSNSKNSTCKFCYLKNWTNYFHSCEGFFLLDWFLCVCACICVLFVLFPPMESCFLLRYFVFQRDNFRFSHKDR